jgi:hypothetical protein
MNANTMTATEVLERQNSKVALSIEEKKAYARLDKATEEIIVYFLDVIEQYEMLVLIRTYSHAACHVDVNDF